MAMKNKTKKCKVNVVVYWDSMVMLPHAEPGDKERVMRRESSGKTPTGEGDGDNEQYSNPEI
jgi:hypothetical protein